MGNDIDNLLDNISDNNIGNVIDNILSNNIGNIFSKNQLLPKYVFMDII